MVVAAVGWGVASARDDDLTGRPVSDEHLTTIQAAARSCPALTPARLAGQLMAESGLDPRATRTASGGQGIAGLTDEAWKKWAPWPGAKRSDSAANIIALAHKMCDLSGQLRLTEVAGDSWRLSLAAFHRGLDTVRETDGIPPAAVEYVDQATGYAAYYGRLVPFGGSGDVRPTADPQKPKAVPAEYTRLIVQAGSVCGQVPPPAVAAQVMALSGFDVNLLGAGDRRGIAQFLPEVWQTYGPDGTSAWNPEAAIPTVGLAMCGLHEDLSGLEGDPYLLALAAFRNGPTAVRQAGGDLDAATESFARTVRDFTEFYALDGRLKPKASPSPTPSGEPSPSPEPSPTGDEADPSPSPSASPKPPAGEPDEPPAPEEEEEDVKPGRPTGAKQLVNARTGYCVSSGKGGDGAPLTLQKCREDASQWWVFRTDGTVRSQGLCMDVAWADTADGTPVQLAHCSGNAAQKWQWHPERKSLMSGLAPQSCLDHEGVKLGAPLNLWWCVFNPEQTWTVR
ncbi:ricin-type beta-trefoil lectin domain protein [Micromonospora fluostatini]|uniref:ricin-type beta-trefoil lectin domain protein n=1 Tax=Micromonospora sp. JCM 30529 TaxID=3421643 RepID=UPI003D16B521